MVEYKTIKHEASAEFTEKKSKFIGYVKPVSSEKSAIEFIQSIKSQNYNANHNVFAYLLRENGLKRYTDDGEPQGTAGIPILDLLEKEELVDCAVVVTRYFGGTLLGTGGLVRAYTHGAKLAIGAGGILTMRLYARISVNCSYDFFGKLTNLIKSIGGIEEESQFTDTVNTEFSLVTDNVNRFEKILTESSAGKYKANMLKEEFLPI